MLQRLCDRCGKIMQPEDNDYPIIQHGPNGWSVSIDIKDTPNDGRGDVCHQCALDLAQFGKPSPDDWLPKAAKRAE